MAVLFKVCATQIGEEMAPNTVPSSCMVLAPVWCLHLATKGIEGSLDLLQAHALDETLLECHP